MTDQGRPQGRRLGSGGWSRLKPGSVDALESMGLPSKGETRLNDYKAQESYYAKITDRYVNFCADCGSTDELERQFASFSLNETEQSHIIKTHRTGDPQPQPQSQAKPQPAKLQKPETRSKPSSSPSTSPPVATPSNAELAILLSAMRKLRESLVATSRTDHFAQRAYIFLTRAAILVKSYPNYQPALLYLLQRIHPRTPLPRPELHEFVGYRVLDLACREGDLGAAHELRCAYGHADRKVERVLAAVVRGDWVTFWRVKRSVDGHQRRLVEWAEEGMRLHALKCLGKSYFTAEPGYVEACADMRWEALVEECNVGWELDEERRKVTIRRPKARQ